MAKELYVGHISENAYEEDIRKLFSVMGTVTSVHLIIDPETREFKRCGYVRMAADVDPKEVVETLDGAYLVDQVITVSIARPQKPGMSKSGKPGKFGGPRKPGFGPKTGAAPRGGNGPKSHGEPKARPERTRGSETATAPEPRSGVRSRPASGSKSGVGAPSRPVPNPGRAGRGSQSEGYTGEAAARPEQKSGRGQRPSSRPTREGGRTRESKPRRP